MTTIIDAGWATRHRPAPVARLLRNLRAWWRRWRHHRRLIATHIALSRMDERLLYDIGLERLDLIEALAQTEKPSIVRGPGRR